MIKLLFPYADQPARQRRRKSRRKRVDPVALRALTDALPIQREAARDSIRRLRKQERY